MFDGKPDMLVEHAVAASRRPVARKPSLSPFAPPYLDWRAADAMLERTASWPGKSEQKLNPVATRARLLELSVELFRQSPLTGVGNAGWTAAVDPLFLSDRFAVRFSQAHNQFANDFAKGGLVRGLAGIAFILVPLLLFVRSKPLADRQESLPALLGLITCIGFAAFSLTESVMILNLPAAIYCILTFYLMAAKPPHWRKPAGWPDQLDRGESVTRASTQ
jgi:O-antigen ligase